MEDLLKRAAEHFQANQFEAAIQVLNEALAAEPDSIEVESQGREYSLKDRWNKWADTVDR